MRRAGTGFVVKVLAVLVFAAPAAAHGGDPAFTVEQTHPDDTSVHYIIRMVWANDGDPIDGKVVTATPTAPDGTAGVPVTLTGSGDGRYEGTIEMPTAGSWPVTFASPDPEGSYNHIEVRPERPLSTTTSTTSTTETDEPTEDEAAANSSAGAADAGDDDSGLPILIVVAALVVAIGGGLAAIRIVRQNSTPKPD